MRFAVSMKDRNRVLCGLVSALASRTSSVTLTIFPNDESHGYN